MLWRMTDGDTAWLGKLRGRFVVFDGPDGAGKSTQYRRFAQRAERAGIDICEVREPGGTNIGERIRDLLLDPANDDMDMHCEMLLYMASRAQLVAQRIRPALNAGQLVLADRFISSTLAYQGAAGGLAIDDIMAVGRIALRECWPHLTIVFDVDERTAAKRLNPLLDRIEQRGAAFHRVVRQGFLDQARQDPQRYLVVDATPDADAVQDQLLTKLAQKLQ